MSVDDIYLEVCIKTEDYLPLREPTFFILLSISSEKKHGYAILKEVEELSRGAVKLSNGTLYGALVRLQDQGLIERVTNDQHQTSGKPRKAYRLTKEGLEVLNAEIKRLNSLVKAASQRLPEGSL